MTSLIQYHRVWQTNPLIGLIVSEWQAWQQEQMQPWYRLAPILSDTAELTPYVVDMEPLLSLPFGNLDEVGVLYNRAVGRKYPAGYHPTSIAQYALAQWNAYLNTGEESHRNAFLLQARWLIEHESPLANGAGGWPIPFPLPEYDAPTMWLSALTQGNVISVLVRAYRVTGEEVFLQSARRAISTFERDIQDGGVAAFQGANGVFFEEVASNPASHILNGYILALFGLYDYVAYIGDSRVEALIKRSLTTLHTLINRFDIGYWSCYDLRFRIPSPLFYHALHVTLLEGLARFSGCQHCAVLAARWDRYQQSRVSRLRYFVTSRVLRCRRALQRKISSSLFRGKRYSS